MSSGLLENIEKCKEIQEQITYIIQMVYQVQNNNIKEVFIVCYREKLYVFFCCFFLL
jgi:hypothetical protein